MKIIFCYSGSLGKKENLVCVDFNTLSNVFEDIFVWTNHTGKTQFMSMSMRPIVAFLRISVIFIFVVYNKCTIYFSNK